MKIFHAVCICAGLALLGVLVWSTGPRQLWTDLAKLGWGLVPLIAIELVAQYLHTLGWRHCLSGALRDIPTWRLFRIRMAGLAVNHLTPTADMGGEVTRGTLLARYQSGSQAASGVIIGKLSYTLSQLLFIGTGSVIVLWNVRLPPGMFVSLVAGGGLLLAGVLGFLVVQKYGKLGSIVRRLAARGIGGAALRRAAVQITAVDGDMCRFYRDRPAGLALSMVWHMAGMTCGIVQSWYFFTLVGNGTPAAIAAGVWLLGGWLDLLCFMIPSNIGVLEGTRVLAFQLLQQPAGLGLLYGVALRLEQLTMALIGMGMYGCFMLPSLGKNRHPIPCERKSADEIA